MQQQLLLLRGIPAASAPVHYAGRALIRTRTALGIPAASVAGLPCALGRCRRARFSGASRAGVISEPGGLRWSSSSSRWTQRQSKDHYTQKAKVQNLKSRAAYKLIEMNAKHKFFKRGQTVVDLGYAPGSWSQVAVELTKPSGTVVGIDLIPAQPPRGVSTIQGNFLSPYIQNIVKEYLAEVAQRQKENPGLAVSEDEGESDEVTVMERLSYIDTERAGSEHEHEHVDITGNEGRLVDLVLSDMSEPWKPDSGFTRTLSNPYRRMMNTSGMAFRDHAGSMNLCLAALKFASDTLRAGGHFVCKFYQGAEDKALEKQLKKIFAKVYREKPDSSRKESKEAYFVALRRLRDAEFSDTES